MTVIDSFMGQYRWLSNFHRCEIHYEGLVYPSTEHAYQAAKLADAAQRYPFVDSLMTCGGARKFGQKITIRPGWDDMKVNVMFAVTFEKYQRHLSLQAALLGTGDAELVEGNTWGDRFWGVCAGLGENHLGKTLMKVRSLLTP